jgi:protein required for attachment to host cells
MKHPRTWYVVADGGQARILRKRETHDAFDTHREFESADIHRPTRDLGTDRPGRTQESAGSARHAIQPRADYHRAEKRSFVSEVAKALNEARARDEFDRLVLVAPASALAVLKKALDGPTQQMVAAELQKDLTKVPNADLGKHFDNLGRH